MKKEARIQRKKNRITEHRRRKTGAVYRCLTCKAEYPESVECCGRRVVLWDIKIKDGSKVLNKV